MGNKLFGVDIAGIIHGAMSSGLLPATLTHRTPGVRGADSTAGTQPNETTHTCRGFIDDYKKGEVDGTLVLVGDKKILLIGDSISPAVVPEPGDAITIEGEDYRITNPVERDPAAATYVCQGRRPS
jgi:hypothetical protein